MTDRLDSLIGDDYTVMRFADMPVPYQLSVIWFMAVDGEAWDGVDITSYSCDDIKPALTDLRLKYVELYGDTLFGSAFLSATAIQDSIMLDAEIAESFSSWDEYHADYLSGGAPAHPVWDRWPVILSSDESETLRDGWHRFHSYVRDGAAAIHTVFFPEDRHILAHAPPETTEKPDLPEPYKSVLSGLEKRHGQDFFMEGACVCLSVILQEVARSQNHPSSIKLVLEDGLFLHHAFVEVEVDGIVYDMDIQGAGAEARYMEGFDDPYGDDSMLSVDRTRGIGVNESPVEYLVAMTKTYGMNYHLADIAGTTDKAKSYALLRRLALAQMKEPEPELGL